MNTLNRTTARMMTRLCLGLAFILMGHGIALAQDPPADTDTVPTTQPAADDPIEAAKAAALASTQPARPVRPTSPRPAPGALQNGGSAATQPAATPVAAPQNPRVNPKQPSRSTPAGRPEIPSRRQPVRSTPPTGAVTPPGVRSTTPGNPRINPRVTPAEQPGADVTAQPEVGDEGPVMTNTKTRMLVFQIEDPQPEARTYRFQYVNTPWQDVLTDFSRVSGLPLVNLPDPPISGNLTYFSNDEYTFEEALHKLNELLGLNPLNNFVIQRRPKYMTVERIPDLVRKIPPENMFNSFAEFKAANLDPYEVCLVKIETPSGWEAYEVIEQYRSMFSDTYGTEIIGPRLIQLTGLVKEHLLWDEIVTKLSQTLPDRPKPNLIYKLKAQKAAVVQTMLNQLYQIAPVMPKARPGTPGTIDQSMQEAQQLVITPDITNNVLYIRGPQYLVDEIKATLERIDVGEWKAPENELFKLQNATANGIVTTLKPIFQKKLADLNKTQLFIPEEMKAAMEVDIFPDLSSNSVIIVGGEEGRAQARKLIEQYDIPAEWITEIIQLKHAKADDVMPHIQSALQRMMARGAGQMMPQVSAHTSDSLLVSCSPTDLREIRSLLEKIDAPNPEEPHEHIVTLEYAVPSEIIPTIMQVIGGSSGAAAAPRVFQAQPTPRGKGNQNQAAAQLQQMQQMQQARQAQMLASGGGGGGGTGPLLIPNDDARTLMVYCADKDWPKIEDLVSKLDASAGVVKPRLHTIELKKANPEDVAAMVNSMFPPQPGSMTPQIVTADVYNNTIQIFARPDFVEQVIPLIETLDINATSELTVIRLEHCKADVIAPILAQGIPGAQAITTPRANVPTPGQPQRPQVRPGQPQQVTQRGDTSVRIVAEPVTNSLLVTAPPKELEQIQRLVREMEEVAATKFGPDTQVIVALQHRSAEEVAATLTSLLGTGPTAPRPGVPGAQAIAGEVNPNAEQLKVVSNGDRLILKGPQTQVAEALQIIERIDVADQAPLAKVYAVNDAETDEQKLRSMLAGRVAAPNARPTPVRPTPGRAVQGGQNVQQVTIPTQTDGGIQIYADTYQNSLLIRALPKDFPEIEEMLRVILSEPPDETIAGGKKPPEQFFMVKLKHKSAWDLGYTLEDLVNRDDRSKVEFKEGPTDKDMIVMKYKPGQEETIRKYIDMFDVSDSPGTGRVRLYDPESKFTAAQIEAFFQLQGGKTKSGKSIKFINSGDAGRVQIIDIHADEAEATPSVNETPAPATGAAAPADSAKPAASSADRAAENTTSSAAPVGTHLFTFPYSVAFEMASVTLAQTAPADPTPEDRATRALRLLGVEDAPAGTTTDHIQIIVDPETGRFMLVGPEEDIDEIIELLDELKDEESPTVVRVFPLKYADVNQASQLLNQVFNQQAAPQAPPQRGRQQGPQQQQQQGQPQIDPRTGQPMPQAQQPQQQQAPMPQAGGRRGAQGGAVLKVVPDERTKSLFVVARQADIPLIIEVLREIDKRQIVSKNMRFFRLQNLEAAQVVESLREILGIQQVSAVHRGGRGRPGQQVQQGQPQGGEQQIVGIPGAEGGAMVSADSIKLTAESQTNTIIAQASPDTLDLIEGLIKELEDLENTTRWSMRRVELKHARATDIADIVDDLARELLPGGGGGGPQQPQQPGPGGGRGGRRGGVNRVLVEADPRTNSVIVAGQEKDLLVCEKIINDLDVDEGDNTVRQFTIKGTPTEFVPTLKELFGSNRGGGRGGENQDVIITANDATKTILVKAPPPQMAEIERHIIEMDAKVEATTAIREIKLSVANAETVATKLNEVFSQQPGGRGRAQGDVSIKGVKANNTLYVRCPDDMFESIKSIALSMDQAPSDVQVSRFTLKNAVAQNVLQQTQQLMAEAFRPGGSAAGLNLDFVGVTADPRTNSLVLVGGPTSALLLKSVIDQIDVAPETPMVRSTAAYTLPAGQDVNQVVNNINQLFQGVSVPTTGVEAPKVTANASANLIIVEANQDQQKKIKEGIIDPILNNVDKKQDFVYQVKNAQATQLAGTLSAQLRAVMPQVGGRFPVNITGDDGANTLLVNATEADYANVMKLIEQLDVPPKDRVTRAFKVKYVAPWTMANIINQQYGTVSRNANERVTAAYEDGTMSIVVTANSKYMEQIANLIEETDKPGQTKETRFVQLKEARADEVARAIESTLQGKVTPTRSGVPAYKVTPDLSSNVIVITAESQLFPEIDQLVAQLDVPSAMKGQMVRKSIKLTFADPGAVANNIRQSYQSATGNPSPRDRVVITENWTTNSVFITASEDNMRQIETDILTMDSPDGGGRLNHVIEVANANPNDVAQAVQALFQDVFRMKRQQTPPSIKAIPGTTKIIAYASNDEFAQIRDLIDKVDTEGGRIVHTVALPEQVPARSVSETITRLFGSRGGPGGDGPKAEYHEPTNALLVSATNAEFEKIKKQVIDPLSDTTAVGQLNFYKIPLKFAVANEVAQTLQEFFDKKAGVGRQNNLPPWMRTQNANEQRDNQVTVMAETGSNTLLVYATETTKKLIDELIIDIDVDRTIGQSIEMVALNYVDAKEMLDVMTEVLKVQKRTSAEDRQPIPWWMDSRRNEEEEEVVLAGGMRLKAIESSNSLIISGKSESVADAVAKVKELDVPTGIVRPETFAVTNGMATDMAEVLKKVFVEGREPAGRGAAAAQKLTIVADESANTLIVRGKTSDVNAVLDMAKQMDQGIDPTIVGIQIVQVPAGQNVETMARDIQDQINETERNKAQRISGYKADLVTITPNTRANVLMVSASKANLEEVKKTVQSLVALGPAGGQRTVLIPITSKLSPQQVRDFIQQMQEGQNGGSSGGSRGFGGRRGPRSDANWTRDRRYEKLNDNAGRKQGRARGTTVAATMPVMMMHLAFSTSMAQTTQPQVHTIRPRVATTQPATTPQRPRVTHGGTVSDTIRESLKNQPAPDARVTTTAPAGMSLNRLIESSTQPSDFQNWSPGAREALQLTGAEVTVTEAGPGNLAITGLESDVETIQQLIRILEESVPDKRVEYFRLKNANAADLAQTLSTVFQRLEQSGPAQPLPQDRVDIIPDSRTNGLYVAASDQKMVQARTLIEQADTPLDVAKSVRAFTFRNRRVSESGEVLRKLIDSYLKQRKLDPSLISVEIDPQTNTAFVTAGESDLEIVKGFVDLLDAEIVEDEAADGKSGGQGRADIMVVPLRVAKADTLATLLSGLLEKAATGDTPMKDFIRRLRLLDENGQPLATVDLNKPIFVFGDPDSNALMIASTIENCLIMKQVALAFDKEPAKSEVVHKVYTLVYADAEEVATRFNDMLADSEQLTKRPGEGETKGVPEGESGAIVYRAIVKADPRTNQVVVVGRPDAVQIFDALVAQLDVKGRGVMPFEIVRLEFASPAALATALTEMLDKRKEAIPGANEAVTKSETVIITPDARSQSLIIAAKQERMEELKGLIRQLDVKTSALVENVRTIRLKNSNATELAEKLKDLWTQTRDQREGGQEGGLGFEIPAMVADARSNSIIISASLSDFEAIKGVVDKIENLELNPMANIYIVRMKYNSASQLSEALQSLFQARAEMRDVNGEVRPEDKVSIEVDETTNSLLVAASRENYELLLQKVQELDVEVGVMGQVEFFPNENVDAYRLKDVIDNLFEQPLIKPGATPTGEGAETRERVTTVVDDRSNTLIVTASPENMAIIREIHKRMNSLTAPWDIKDSRVVQLQHADAVQIAAQVEDYFDRLQEATGGGQEAAGPGRYAVRIFADEKRNRVIIGGTRDGIQRAIDLIQQLDVPAGETNQPIRVYSLNEAPASKVADMLRNIFQERNQPRGETGAQVPDIPVTIEANDAARTIVVNASRLDHALIEELIRQLDRPSALLDMVRVFPLAHARAERVKELIDEVYQSVTTGADTGGQTVAVVADERTNSVVVAAPPGEMTNVETIIGRLDTSDFTSAVEVGIIPCENEDAEKMAEILNQIMMGQGGEGGTTAENENLPPAATRALRFASKMSSGERRVLQSVRENVQISFNARSNSVVVVAPPDMLELIESLVRKLDSIEKKEVLVKVFILRNADATKTVEILEKMFAQDEASGEQAEFQQGRQVTVEGGMSSTGGTPTAFSQAGDERRGTFGKPKTTFIADERTNGIVAAGWASDLDAVADILDQLDATPIQERESIVYTAVNMKAVDMQTALESYFQAEKSALEGIESVSPQQRLERDVAIVAHEESNQLIVSVSPRQKSRVLSIIEQIDAAPPQVMIQVMIAEVTIDDRFEMGLEFALQELRFSETAVPGGNGILQSSHFDVVGGTDLGAAGSGLGGFSFTITGEDFNFLVRALQSDSRLEVIQHPMIMCQDNQVANISIGSRVPIPSGTGTTTGGVIQTQVTYEEVGVILDVEPNINPDGWVYLKVAPEVSDLASSTIQVSPGTFAPVITSRKADTFVAVKDGETVVIGGLITTSDSESESKVPLLGDVPGLGALFRTTTRVKRKTELLIALTPRIVRTVEDGYRMSIEQRDMSGIITDEMKSSPLFGKLRITPEEGDTIDSIETLPPDSFDAPPRNGVPTQPIRDPNQPAPRKYGPEVPKYGPMVPSEPDDEIVARRSRR